MEQQRKYFVLFFLLVLTGTLAGQEQEISALKTKLSADKPDTNMVNHLSSLGRIYMYSNPDTSMIIGARALTIAQQTGWKKGIADALGNLGIYSYFRSDLPKALDYYQQALLIDQELNDKAGMAKRYGNIGLVYKSEADYPRALDFYLKALKLDEQFNDDYGLAADLDNIGIVYEEQGEYQKALDYYFRALKIDRKMNDQFGTASDLANIGVVYKNLGQNKNTTSTQRNQAQNWAIENCKEALMIADKNGFRQVESNALNVLGSIYKDQNEFSRSLELYQKATRIDEELGDKAGVTANYGNIGALYIETKNFRGAFDCIYRALNLADSLGTKDQKKFMYLYLSQLYERSTIPLKDSLGGKILNMEGMRLRALHYFKSYSYLRDSIFGDENRKQLLKKELSYQYEKKQAEVKAEADKQAALAEEQRKKQNIILWSVVAVLLLVVAFSVFVYRALRESNKQKKMIELQREALEEKQKEILDSIHYAKRIQTSLLPTIRYIEKHLARLKDGRKK
jgi:tetratricopeptide (TPR) repeat protein